MTRSQHKVRLQNAIKEGEEMVQTVVDAQNGILHNTGSDRLKAFVSRIERLEAEKAALADDIKEIYNEAKSVGFDAPTIRKVVKLKKQDDAKRREEMILLDTYSKALQMDLFGGAE